MGEPVIVWKNDGYSVYPDGDNRTNGVHWSYAYDAELLGALAVQSLIATIGLDITYEDECVPC